MIYHTPYQAALLQKDPRDMFRHLALCFVAALAAPAAADPPNVLTDIAPVHGLTSMVMEGLGTPVLLLKPGQSAHHRSLRPSEVRSVDAADVVFWVGEDLTPWLTDILSATQSADKAVALLRAPETLHLTFRDGPVFSLAENGHDDHDHGHDDHDHGKAQIDPHAWLDPENAIVWLRVIADHLSKSDPANAGAYWQNAQTAIEIITSLISELQAQSAETLPASFVVYHDAYQYFERRFGLRSLGSIADSHATDPGAARIAKLRKVLSEADVRCVFIEPQFNRRRAVALAEGSEMRVTTLDPLGAGIDLGPEFYPRLIRGIHSAMAKCI